jgi:hypothetical protein
MSSPTEIFVVIRPTAQTASAGTELVSYKQGGFGLPRIKLSAGRPNPLLAGLRLIPG